MQLALLSVNDKKINKNLNDLLRLLFKGRKRLTFIPSSSHGCEPYFKAAKSYFRHLGAKEVDFFSHDRDFTRSDLARVFRGDAIFLSGGNTYYFLKSLKYRRLLGRLQKFARAGGLLIGASAGSIIMTPRIHTASLPSYSADSNDVALEDLDSLALVPFEFGPHADFSEGYRNEMSGYTHLGGRTVIGCGDGGGVIIDGSKTTVVGPAEIYARGEAVFSNVHSR